MAPPGDDALHVSTYETRSMSSRVSKRSRAMLKVRTARALYFLGVIAAFVVAAGADRKFR
jgi:hypothetical protein